MSAKKPTANLRDAAQQALEALEKHDAYYRNGIPQTWFDFVGKPAITDLRTALADTQDWDELEALRASLREHMAEIHRLRAAGRQALEALEDSGLKADLISAADALRAALEPVTECHDLEQARAVAISNLLAHFGITSADSDVNVTYLHKLLDDFLMASIGYNKGGGNLPPPLTAERLAQLQAMNERGTIRRGHVEEMLRALEAWHRSADTGKTSDHIADANKMVATSQESRQVEPIGYFSINDYGNWEQNESGYGKPLYEAPPKREPLTEEQIESAVCNAYVEKALTRYDITIARAIERAHGIGGEE